MSSCALCYFCSFYFTSKIFLAHTCIFGPFKNGGDLIALCGVTLAPHSSCTHAHCALVGLHSTQVCRGCASTVCHLSVRVVGLQKGTGYECLWNKKLECWANARASWCLGLDPDIIIKYADN